ncbi:bacterioferritin [Pseudemcibacter aquimaris]|uniref:bacterioferritin n=1 Tax=Pseudemcibacter aquimaris TaxID=2857064 RepID=UPI002011F5DB|nr:bacterioferritin [Pseudemcibacter aquimaris]MCC3860945.1 bacterioferritin [Pseudemcibacter aquimaris]WDU59764.1 bacterioferritin [Pseudemcibacter aquimaris]
MKGNQKIIDALNSLLTHELSAADQYFIHSQMYEDMGLEALYTRLEHEREEELDHAKMLVERILFLEGKPDVGSRAALNIGDDVPSMLKSDLDYELMVVDALKDVIELCEKERDYQTRQILLKLLEDTEEDHTYWLEKQLGLIEKVGLQNYMQSQMGSAG